MCGAHDYQTLSFYWALSELDPSQIVPVNNLPPDPAAVWGPQYARAIVAVARDDGEAMELFAAAGVAADVMRESDGGERSLFQAELP